MANRKTSLMSEKYLIDACQSIFSNLTRVVREREELFIWGPKVPTYTRNNFRSEVNDKWNSSTLVDGYSTVNKKLKEQNSSPSSVHRNDDEMFRIRTENQDSEIPKHMSRARAEGPSKLNHKKRTMSEDGESENSRKNPAFGNKRNGDLLDRFAEWCNKRHTEFEGIKLKTLANNSVNCSPTFKNKMEMEQKIISEPEECLSEKQKPCTMNRNAEKNSPNNVIKENHIKDTGDKDFLKNAAMKKERVEGNKDLNLLSIKVSDENDEKSYEFIKKLSDILRIKRKYPKLLEIIPNIDGGGNEINYSMEAMNIILRYVVNQDYKLEGTLCSPICGIEVLAATRSWEIFSLHEKFKDYFLHNAVTPSNASLLFSYACKYGLQEVCNVCKDIAPPDMSHIPRTYRRDKRCFITISTYVSPLECNIPLTPLLGGLQMSFERHIKNTIQFQAVSGCYEIVGFQVQLNADHLNKSKSVREGTDKLNIYYNAKNKFSSHEILDKSVEKYLRPINIVYFKKGLIVNSGEIGEIVVEVDVKPYLCSSLKNPKIKYKSGKFKILALSSFSLRNSVNELFFIKKLFYHVIK